MPVPTKSQNPTICGLEFILLMLNPFLFCVFYHLSLFKGHLCPPNPQKRRYFRYLESNLPTYIFFKSLQSGLPIRYINTPMSRVSCLSNENPEKKKSKKILKKKISEFFFSQDFHYLDKKPLTWGCLYTLWEVPIARIWKNICRKVIFGVPEIGGFGGVDDL